MNFPQMEAPLKPRRADPLLAHVPPLPLGYFNPKRTWTDIAKLFGGARTQREADYVLWSGSAYPFARPRYVVGQLRHVARHKVCFDDPGATCQPRRLWRHA